MVREDFEQQELEELEKKLKQLPKIKDRRSKEEIYLNIKSKLNEDQQPKRNKTSWLTPAIASIAAVILIVAIAPTFFNQESDIAIPTEDLERGMATEEEALIPEAGTFMVEDEAAENNAVNYISAIRGEDLAEGQRLVTIPYVDPNAMFVVPISFITREDEPVISQVNQLIEHYDPSVFGLGESSLSGVVLSEKENSINIDIPSEKLYVGTTELEMLRQSIELIGASLEYDRVLISREGSTPVEFGNYGEVNELQISDRAFGYFIYETQNNQRLLIPANFIYYPFVEKVQDSLTFEETLLEMQNTDLQIGYQASIPPEVNFTVAEDDKGLLTITFSDTVNEQGDIILLSMIEAILLTAKDFQHDYIEVKGIKLDQIGPYDLTGPISTNIAPNGGGY